MRKTEEIKKEVTVKGGDRSVNYTHPSFGMVSVNRVFGHRGILFGSHLQDHHTTIELTIKKGKRNHHLGQDWYSGREELINITLSAAQFVEMITTMNMGDGIPCTIRHVGREYTPDIPDEEDTESERVEEEFVERMQDRVSLLKENEDKIEEILNKKSIGKKDRETIKELVFQARRYFVDSAPFAIKSFHKAKQKVVTSVKAEVESFMNTVVHNAGLKAIEGKQMETPFDGNGNLLTAREINEQNEEIVAKDDLENWDVQKCPGGCGGDAVDCGHLNFDESNSDYDCDLNLGHDCDGCSELMCDSCKEDKR